MITAKVVQRFYDKRADVVREVDDTFNLSKKRFKEINSAGNGILVEQVKEKPKAKGEKNNGTRS